MQRIMNCTNNYRKWDMKQETKGNYAFISYSHKDKKLAKKIQSTLESFKLPATIHNEFCESRYLRPVFRDETDIEPGPLGERLKTHLQNSKFLIVICSPDAAESKYVNDEVRYFIDTLGRYEYVIPVLSDSAYNSANVTGSFPIVLQEYAEISSQGELLAADIHSDGLRKASVRIIARMLGIQFDEIWKRDQRARRRKIFSISITSLIAITAILYLALPITLVLKFNTEKRPLPSPTNCVINVNGTDYRIGTLDSTYTLVINDIPGYLRGSKITCSYNGDYCIDSTIIIKTGIGKKNKYDIAVERDSTFAVYAGVVLDAINGSPVPKAKVIIEDLFCETDETGYFKLFFPIEKQTETKSVKIQHPLYRYHQRDNEHPSSSLGYILIRK